jgi:hypothetical protein
VFHSNPYNSSHKRNQFNLARDNDVFAYLVKALLPLPSHILFAYHTTSSPVFIAAGVFILLPTQLRALFCVSFHFMSAAMFSFLDVTCGMSQPFPFYARARFALFQECLASSRSCCFLLSAAFSGCFCAVEPSFRHPVPRISSSVCGGSRIWLASFIRMSQTTSGFLQSSLSTPQQPTTHKRATRTIVNDSPLPPSVCVALFVLCCSLVAPILVGCGVDACKLACRQL